MIESKKRLRALRRPSAIAAVLLTGGIALSACGGSSSTTTTSTTPPTSTTLPASSSTTSTTAAVAVCSTGVLTPSASAGGSAAGTAYETFTVTNGAATPCSIDGYPTITLFAPGAAGGAGTGSKLSVGVEKSGTAATSVTLASKGAASFLVVFSDVPAGGVGCETVASAEITLPDSAESLSLPVQMDPCGGSVKLYPYAAPGTESP